MSATDEEKEARSKIKRMTQGLLGEKIPGDTSAPSQPHPTVPTPRPNENPFPDTPFPAGLKELPADRRQR